MKKWRQVVNPKNIPSTIPLNNKEYTNIGFPRELFLLTMVQIHTKICTNAINDTKENA